MTRTLSRAAGLLLGVAAVVTPAAAQPALPKAAADRVKQSVARIEVRNGHGSGFLVAPDVVVTNTHVILNDLPDEIVVRFSTDGLPDEVGYKAELLYADKARDLALLRLKSRPNPTRAELPLAKVGAPVGGAGVYVIGNPGQGGGAALSNTIGVARWDAEVVTLAGKPFYRILFPASAQGDIRIGRGNSGGPATNDKGEVIGILTRGEIGADNRPTGKAYLVPVKAVQAALDAVGPPAGWGDVVKKATVRHALDLAVVNRHAHAMLAGTILDERVGLKQLGLVPAQQAQVDRLLITQSKAVGKQLQQTAAAADKIVAENRLLLTPDQRGARDAAKSALDELRRISELPMVTAAQLKVAQAKEDQVYKAVGKVREESGVREDVLRAMFDGIEADLNGVLRLEGVDPVRLRSRDPAPKN